MLRAASEYRNKAILLDVAYADPQAVGINVRLDMMRNGMGNVNMILGCSG